MKGLNFFIGRNNKKRLIINLFDDKWKQDQRLEFYYDDLICDKEITIICGYTYKHEHEDNYFELAITKNEIKNDNYYMNTLKQIIQMYEEYVSKGNVGDVNEYCNIGYGLFIGEKKCKQIYKNIYQMLIKEFPELK